MFCRLHAPLNALVENHAVIAELGFAYRLHDLLDTLLYQPVPNARYAKGSGRTIGFWYLFAPDWFWIITSFSIHDSPDLIHDFFRGQATDIFDRQPICSRSVAPGVGFDFRYANRMFSLERIISINPENGSPFLLFVYRSS